MIFSFSTFVSFVVIFKVLQCVFLIFHVFPFSRHIPGPTVYISHFSRYSVLLAVFLVLPGIFLIFPRFHVFFFNDSCHDPGSTVGISHFLSFSVFLALFQVMQCLCLIFHVFQFCRQNPGPTFCISHI